MAVIFIAAIDFFTLARIVAVLPHYHLYCFACLQHPPARFNYEKKGFTYIKSCWQ